VSRAGGGGGGVSVLSSAGQKGLSRKRGAGVPGGKRAEYMRVDQGVESSRYDQEGGGREGRRRRRGDRGKRKGTRPRIRRWRQKEKTGKGKGEKVRQE
jgi:hypothetical protein